jgi:hypothetical protein
MSEYVLSFDVGIKNLGVSILEKKDGKFNIILCNVINIEDTNKCKDSACKKPACYFCFESIELKYTCCKKHMKDGFKMEKIKKKTTLELCKELVKKLDFLNEYDYQNVVIENQPSMINPIMKSIQCYLIMYYTLKNKNIILQSPMSKTFNEKFTGKSKYRDTKLHCLKICNNIFKDDKKFLQIKENNKKIDDICDSLCHGLYFLCSGKKIKISDE